MSRRARLVLVVVAALALLLLAAGLFVVFARSSARSAPEPSASESKAAAPREPTASGAGAQLDSAPRAEKSAAPPSADGRLGGRRAFVVEKNGARRVDCQAACALEADCGLRDAASCLTLSCEKDGALRVVNRSDFCMGEADNCGDAVLCTCEESCWRRGECTGDHHDDKACLSACRTIAAQSPRATFVENRCILESACTDLAACAITGPEPELPMPAR